MLFNEMSAGEVFQFAELAHLSRLHMLGQMACGLAHELNQPISTILNSVVGLQNLVDCDEVNPERIVPAIQMIQSEAKRAGEIIRSLGTLGRKQASKRSRVEMRSLVVEAIRLMELQLRHAGITTRIESCEPPPTAVTDGIQIMQVLINLIRNAVDAMTTDGATGRELTVKLSLHGNSTRVEVQDLGCGVPPEHQSHLFNSFFTTKPNGLGMGLTISRAIVTELGGELKAEPNQMGGMTFIFTCPTQ